MKRKMAALVLGNADYPAGDELDNPVNDAEDICAKLQSYDFEVILGTDCSNADMEKKLKKFRLRKCFKYTATSGCLHSFAIL